MFLAMFLKRGPGVLFMTTKILASLRGEKMSRAKKGNDQKAILLKAPHALHSHFRQLAPGASSHLLARSPLQSPTSCPELALSALSVLCKGVWSSPPELCAHGWLAMKGPLCNL